MSNFETEYKRLNPQQKEAVDTIDGPVMVVAGPGTGKTQILTLRIANILKKTDTDPENILAITFTESGVISMRRRLASFIGSPAYAAKISTFHGFCNEIIQGYPEEFEHIIGSTPITEVDQIAIIKDIIDSLKLQFIKPFGATYHYLHDIRHAMEDLKREGIDPESFKKIIEEEREKFEQIDDLYHQKGRWEGKMKGKYQKREKILDKNTELAKVYAEYQKSLRQEHLYDYSDMIMETLSALQENKDLLLMLQEQYHYILVDEHQDTNTAQNKILELLCGFHTNPNIFVVGDEKQAIFRFQGASLENFLYFKELYKNARLIVLESNYRSSQAILDAAHALLPGKKPLTAQQDRENKPVIVRSFTQPETEHYFLMRDIEKKIEAGTPPHEIAILYRDNKDAGPIALMLERAGVPYLIRSDEDILDDADIQKLILIFRTVANFGSQEYFAQALHIDFLKVEPFDIFSLLEHSSKNKISLFSVAKSPDKLEELDLIDPERVHEVFNMFSRWTMASKNKTFAELFEEIVRESGFLSHILSHESRADKLDALSSLFNKVKQLIEKHKTYKLEDFLEYIDILEEHGVRIRKSASGIFTQDRVQLMTAHRAKGLEFDYVYITGAYDGHWGNRKLPQMLPLPARIYALMSSDLEPGNSIDDERRLFYVALTRAKKHVEITYSELSSEGKEQLPTQFIEEMDEDLREEGEVDSYEDGFAKNRDIQFAPRTSSSIDIKDKNYIKELFLKRGLSVTALNNYLACPWRYFYTNLFRIPKLPSKHQMYGIAVHAALKDFFDSINERGMDKDFLLQKFRFHLQRQPLEEGEFERTLEKGNESLGGYFDKYHTTWNTRVVMEYNIRGVLFSPDIRLTGKLDKLEFLGDGKEVNVVDYKTGKPRSRNYIEGNTKNSDGGIKRQLVFYKLLLEMEEPQKYTMSSAEIDFIEPNESGKYKKVAFEILDEEVEELKKTIERVSGEILDLSFWNSECEEDECEYCKLRKML